MAYRERMLEVQLDLRRQIVEKTLELFIRKGIEPVKMTDVAEEAQVGVASLYRYFGSKTELVAQTGALLWARIAEIADERLNDDVYKQLNGLAQCDRLLHSFVVGAKQYAPYVRFIRDFDLFMEHVNATPDDLAVYERSVLDFRLFAFQAFERGCKDGSIRADLDFDEFYFTSTHTLMLLSQKLVCAGSLVSSDRTVSAARQLETLIAMAIGYIRKGE